jgi:hypothetical protein
MEGRTMKMLSGPETDMSMLLLAIKSTMIDHRPIIVPSVKIYDRSGSAREVKVTCELAGVGFCLLQIEWAMVPQTTPNQHTACLQTREESPCKKITFQVNPRARLNFLMGLTIHKAHLRSAQEKDLNAKLQC